MAQSVEQLIRNQQVAGSSPATSSSSSRTAQVRDDFFMLCIKKSSLTCSVAPCFKTVTASLGHSFVFCLCALVSLLFVRFSGVKTACPTGDLLITKSRKDIKMKIFRCFQHFLFRNQYSLLLLFPLFPSAPFAVWVKPENPAQKLRRSNQRIRENIYADCFRAAQLHARRTFQWYALRQRNAQIGKAKFCANRDCAAWLFSKKSL